jgi:hypothetical protein
VNVGGQALTFANSPQNPYVSLTVGWNDDVDQAPVTGAPIAEFSVDGVNAGSGTTAKFFMAFYGSDLSVLPTIQAGMVLGAPDVELSVGSGSLVEGSEGTITSIQEVPAPEPSTLAIFTGLSVAALVRNRCRPKT